MLQRDERGGFLACSPLSEDKSDAFRVVKLFSYAFQYELKFIYKVKLVTKTELIFCLGDFSFGAIVNQCRSPPLLSFVSEMTEEGGCPYGREERIFHQN